MQQILHQIREKIVADIEKQLGQELDPRRIDIAMGTCDWAAFELSEGVDYRLLEMRYKTYKEVATRFAGWKPELTASASVAVRRSPWNALR